MKIIRCGKSNLDDIYKVEKMSFSDPLRREIIERELENSNACCYAIYEKELISFIIYEKVLDEGQIISVAVHPDYRRKGFAKKLFSEVTEKERAEISVFTLEVRSDNYPAVSLYKGLGFKEVGRRRAYYKNPVSDAVLMDLEIGKD